jgi:hypothetical protein
MKAIKAAAVQAASVSLDLDPGDGLAGWGGRTRTCASESEPLNPTNFRIEMRKFEAPRVESLGEFKF